MCRHYLRVVYTGSEITQILTVGLTLPRADKQILILILNA
jgi:hypothetical protein